MPRLLDSVRVLDFTVGLAGPYCTRTLADLGAQVIKVEPREGDPARLLPPDGEPGRTSRTFIEFNCGKASVSLDLESKPARSSVLRLASLSDVVVVDRWTRTRLARLGLSPPELLGRFPWLVHCSITPYGSTGPYCERPGSGLTADAATAVLDQTGFPDASPMPLGYAFGEMNAGIHAVAGVIAAIFLQRRNGTGQHVDISMSDCSLSVQDVAVQEYLFSGGKLVRTRSGSDRSSLVPYGVYSAPDGYLVMTGWERFCAAINRPDLAADPRFNTSAARERHRKEVKTEIESWLRSVGSAKAAEHILQEVDVVGVRVRSVQEAIRDPHTSARHLLAQIRDSEHGLMEVRDSPFHFSHAVVGVSNGAPQVGEHTDEILMGLCGLRTAP